MSTRKPNKTVAKGSKPKNLTSRNMSSAAAAKVRGGTTPKGGTSTGETAKGMIQSIGR